MTTRTVLVAETEIRCQAAHPHADWPRFAGRPCRKFITNFPFLARFTGRVVEKNEDVPVGYYGAKCPRENCGRISIFEAVSPDQAQSA